MFCMSRVWTVRMIEYNVKIVSNVSRELYEVKEERQLRQRRECEILRREKRMKKDNQQTNCNVM